MSSLDQVRVAVKPYYDQFDFHVLSTLDAKFKENAYIDLAVQKTGFRPSHIVLAAATLLILFLWYGFGMEFVVNLVGFVYPLFESFKALQKKQFDEMTFWLTYWVVYSAFAVLESITDAFFIWIPAYHLAKVAFLIWCFAPHTKGAAAVYKLLIEPFFITHEGQIEDAEKNLEADVRAGVRVGTQELARAAIDNAIADQSTESLEGQKKNQ